MKYPVYPPIPIANRRWPSVVLEESPRWCAVDLRDGNQALPDPMTPSQKLKYFQLLVDIGFKEIEIGFPSASRDDYDFTRMLIEEKMIPDDVTIVVLTQAREHLVEKTLQSLKGANSAVIHFYIATSRLHHEFVFGFTREQLMQTAENTTKMIREVRDSFSPGFLGLEFSPEEFTDTDLDLSLEICDLIVDTWQPREGEKVILNLPATVERRPPTHYADMIEYFCSKLKEPEKSVISLHAHNDQGCAVAATEMALMAGANRVEGTLFGHGERTGNVDLVTLINNLAARNIDTGIDFSNLQEITETVAEITRIQPSVRHPYAGDLVFTAFSGSHQDAIGKSMKRRKEIGEAFDCDWKIPYLHIDPSDLGRAFEKYIRINSQSGKGGISYIMEKHYGVVMPKELLLDFARRVQQYADREERELKAEEVWKLFQASYIGVQGPVVLERFLPRPDESNPDMVHAEVRLRVADKLKVVEGTGNGPISSFADAIRDEVPFNFSLSDFKELSLNRGADARALAYVALEGTKKGVVTYGVGLGTNIDQAAILAFVSALNRLAIGG